MAKRKTKKKAWEKFEIIKVKLNPEQAVLSCCNQPDRHFQNFTQCTPGDDPPGCGDVPGPQQWAQS